MHQTKRDSFAAKNDDDNATDDATHTQHHTEHRLMYDIVRRTIGVHCVCGVSVSVRTPSSIIATGQRTSPFSADRRSMRQSQANSSELSARSPHTYMGVIETAGARCTLVGVRAHVLYYMLSSYVFLCCPVHCFFKCIRAAYYSLPRSDFIYAHWLLGGWIWRVHDLIERVQQPSSDAM